MKSSPKTGWLPLAWFGVFMVAPMGILVAMSFATRGLYGRVEWTLTHENYLRLFDGLYLLIFAKSLGLAAATTLLCLVLSIPLAWAIATRPASQRLTWLILLALPFMVNLISRIYAIRGVLGYDGPLAFLGTWIAAVGAEWGLVLYGMVSSYLMFMFFPVYVAFEKFDYLQIEAAQDLGASSWTQLRRVIWPQLRKPVAAGSVMVFVPALGEFVIPDLLGGARSMMAGGLVTEQFLKSRDWPFGAALAVVLVAIMIFFVGAFRRWGERES
ncbi:MAG: ABC transporter permease [Bdellovibrionaceae bacterium]|nr:ABC transporter permease [Pseudobdellovibrionaceae bacterium]